MSGQTYRVTGITLKGIPLGESDRVITILTREQGLVRAVAKGSRKPSSKWGGRLEPFVINDLLLVRGRWSAQADASQRLQRIVQAETLQSFPRLGRSLAHLTAAQYLAEVALLLALPDQAQEELFVLLVEHLQRIEQAPTQEAVLPLLVHGLYHLLAVGGVAPSLQACCSCGWELADEVFFCPNLGGLICEPCQRAQQPTSLARLSSAVLQALGSLPNPTLPPLADRTLPLTAWLGAERLLRQILEQHAEREIRSARLLAGCYPTAGAAVVFPTANEQGSPLAPTFSEGNSKRIGGRLKKL
ncbi:DNA repair protein RecO [Synechococcus sp. O70.2]|jgi:DNA repair protein RecO (recombination protein O)|uniref:DNA repair protein RecO n=1 Tax=Synechococcus sp. O70.2 TaxID=2964533 RepID=UPI0039C1A8B1